MTGARAVVAVVVVALGLGGGFAIAVAQRGGHEERARQNAQDDATKAWTAVAEQLKAQASEQASRAQNLAKLPAVVQLVSSSTAQSTEELGNTFADLSKGEEWFQSSVGDAQAGLFIGARSIWSSAPVSFDAVRFLEPAGEERLGAVVVDSAKGLLAVGVARVPQPTRNQESGFIVFWKPMPLDAFTASHPAWAFVVSREGSSHSRGSPDGLKVLGEAQPRYRDLPCCTTQELAPAVSLAVFVDPRQRVEEVTAANRRALGLLVPVGGGLGALVAVLLLFLGRRRAAAEEVRDELLRETQVQLRQSQEALQRLSTGAFATQAAAGTPQPAGPLDLALASTQASVTASRYEVVAPLGEGGMARVYVAIVRGAEGFKRTFVLKRLKAEHTGNQELVNQFIDEARLGASLVHSNIVPILDFGRDADGYFLTQEYILGRNVDALIEASVAKRGRPLELELVAAIGQEALKALRYAHTRTDDAGRPAGLVHRDVSPANLMVSRRGEVKLLDFGIVKSADRVTQTQAGMVKGNLFFMSPEQARALPVDPRSDLFSLGMVMATAVLGRTLYSGETMYELMNRAGVGPTTGDLELLAKGAGPLTGFLTKALSIDPSKRCASAAEMADELSAALPAAPSSQLESLMSELFGADLDAERQRFSGAA